MFKSMQTPPKDAPFGGSPVRTWHIRWSETVDAWKGIVSGDKNEVLAEMTPSSLAYFREKQLDGWTRRTDFYGGTIEDAKNYLANGYRVGELRGSFLPGVLRTREGSAQLAKWRFAEFGDEVAVDLALSGVTECFRTYEPQPNIGGMNINAYFAFSADTESDIIAQYGAWIARLLSTCSGAGVSPSVNIVQAGTNLTNGDDAKFQIAMRIKEEGEELDWAAYSAFFSPIGFRHFGFTNLHLTAGAMMRKKAAYGLSSPASCSGGWGLDWDHQTRTLTILNSARPQEFPADEMTAKLIASGALSEA